MIISFAAKDGAALYSKQKHLDAEVDLLEPVHELIAGGDVEQVGHVRLAADVAEVADNIGAEARRLLEVRQDHVQKSEGK